MINNEDKQQLMYSVDKRFQTTMIGSLAQFEKRFSHLWEDPDDEESQRYYDLWQDTRDEILNNGNHQARAAIREIKNILYPNRIRQQENFKFHRGE